MNDIMNKYLVWIDDNIDSEEYANEVEAFSYSEAAEKWADLYDGEYFEYEIASESYSPTICVKENRSDASIMKFDIQGKYIRKYLAIFRKS